MEGEEKEGRDYVGHLVRIIILGWSLSVMTLGYMEKLDSTRSLLDLWEISQVLMGCL